MHKIRKLQTGDRTPYKTTSPYQQPIGFLNQSFTSGLLNSGNKGTRDMMPNLMKLLEPKQLLGTPLITNKLEENKLLSTTGSNKKKFDFFGGLDTAGKLGVANAGLEVVGALGPQLDHVSGASNAIGMAGQVAGMIPGPWGQAAKLALNGIVKLDQLTGKSATAQGTAGATAKGYNLDFNANASTSYGGLFGNKARKTTNLLTAKQDKTNVQKMGASYASDKNMLGAANSMQDVYNKNIQKQNGGVNTRMLAASKGTKLSLTNIVKKVTSKLDTKKEEPKMNVIPSGALHARKHNLPEEIGKQVTNKGIPVVSFEDEGKVVQHCEVEREELTLHKELTIKLEDLLEQYTNANDEEKSKILIKTGKLLTYEILENTQDNVDLINKVE